jgi:hypothetical protein
MNGGNGMAENDVAVRLMQTDARVESLRADQREQQETHEAAVAGVGEAVRDLRRILTAVAEVVAETSKAVVRIESVLKAPKRRGKK